MMDIEPVTLTFIGSFQSYNSMQARAERKDGNVAACFVKKHGGVTYYVCAKRTWILLSTP